MKIETKHFYSFSYRFYHGPDRFVINDLSMYRHFYFQNMLDRNILWGCRIGFVFASSFCVLIEWGKDYIGYPS